MCDPFHNEGPMLTMAKKGRRAKSGARYPSGKLKPEIIKATPETLNRRADLLAIEIRKHPYKLAHALAEHGDASWYVGRLFLLGVLTQQQRDAADRLKRIAHAYEAVLDAPKHPHALDIDRVQGATTESDEAHSRRARRAKAAYYRLHDAMSVHGHDVVRAVTKALNEEEPSLDLLRLGLNAIHDA